MRNIALIILRISLKILQKYCGEDVKEMRERCLFISNLLTSVGTEHFPLQRKSNSNIPTVTIRSNVGCSVGTELLPLQRKWLRYNGIRQKYVSENHTKITLLPLQRRIFDFWILQLFLFSCLIKIVQIINLINLN
jgi:hypothetical protein